MSKMLLTQIEISEKELFDGTKVLNRKGEIKTIKVIPQGKTIYQCVLDGTFDINTNVDYNTVMLNKNLFTLYNEQD